MGDNEIEGKRRILIAHSRRRVKLEEQRALLGYNRDPKIDLELEDIDRAIRQLERELPGSRHAHKSSLLLDPKTWLYIVMFAAGISNVFQHYVGPIAGGIFGVLLGLLIGVIHETVFSLS